MPGQPDNYVSGVLKFNNEENIELELIGSFQDMQSMGNMNIFRPEIILGATNDQKLCTLFKNIQIQNQMSFPGVPKSTFESQYLLIGKHFNSSDEINFSSFQANYTNLENWMATKVFDINMVEKIKTVQYKFPDEFNVLLDESDIKIKSKFEFKSSGEQFRRVEWEHIAFIEVIPTIKVGGTDETSEFLFEEFQDYGGPYVSNILTMPIHFQCLNIEEYWEYLYDINNLLTLLIGETIYPKRIKAFGDEVEIRQGVRRKEIIDIFVAQKKYNLKEDIHPFKMILPYPRIHDKISEILRLWFSNADKLRSVYDLFFGTFYNPSMYLQFHFLSLMQAIESLHRVTKGGKYLKNEEWEPYKNALSQNIPQDLHSDFKASLKSRIKYGNEYSLRKRMKELVNSLDQSTKNMILPSQNYFSGIIVDTRNYLTHYDDELKDVALDGHELAYANQRLKILLILLLLKELNIEENITMKFIRESGKYEFLLGNPFNEK